MPLLVVTLQEATHHMLAALQARYGLVRAHRLVLRQALEPVHGVLLKFPQTGVVIPTEWVALAAEPAMHPSQRAVRVEVLGSRGLRDLRAARTLHGLVGEATVEGEVRLRGAEAAVGAVLVELGLLAVEGAPTVEARGEVACAVEAVRLEVSTVRLSHAVGGAGDASSAERALCERL